MKALVSMTVYTQSACPHCDQQIAYEALYRHFFALKQATEFEYQCPHCLKIIIVHVEMVPTFQLEKES